LLPQKSKEVKFWILLKAFILGMVISFQAKKQGILRNRRMLLVAEGLGFVLSAKLMLG